MAATATKLWRRAHGQRHYAISAVVMCMHNISNAKCIGSSALLHLITLKHFINSLMVIQDDQFIFKIMKKKKIVYENVIVQDSDSL